MYMVLSSHRGRFAMTPGQQFRSRSRLVEAVTGLGCSAELAELIAREPGNPKAIDRTTAYIRQAHPRTGEMLADEMPAIREEIDTWRARAGAQARCNARLYCSKYEDEAE